MQKPAKYYDSSNMTEEDVKVLPHQELEYFDGKIKIYATLNTDQDKLRDNIKENISRGHEQIWAWKDQDTNVCMVGGGPSLLDTIEEIREAQNNGAKVVALANTAHVLLENGITPSAHVLVDAKPNNANFIEDLDIPYFIASQCDPTVFDKLEKAGRKVYIWHAVNDADEFKVIHDQYDKWIPIQGGPTIMLRALRLFSVLGYHKFEIFGFDSCMLEGKHHAYDQEAADGDKAVKIGCNGRDFDVTGQQVSQAMEFMNMVKVFGQNWKMLVHGNGLINHLIRTGAR